MWKPQYGKHVAQYHKDWSGWNDCGEACFARYLFEAYPAYGGNRVKAFKTDITDGPMALVAMLANVARGYPDTPGNGPTSLDQMVTMFRGLNVPYRYTESYPEAYDSPWGLYLVDGTKLEPASWPRNFIGDGGQANHFILSLPYYKGSANWYNDPLSYPDESDVEYTPASVVSAFYGAYLLPNTGQGELIGKTVQVCSLKSQPNHTSHGIISIPKGATFTITSPYKDMAWIEARYNGYSGWLPKGVFA